MFDLNPHSIQKMIKNHKRDIADILKASSHEKRLEVLALLHDHPISFIDLQRKVNLGKTALANQLSTLLKANMITRIDRGYYGITVEGKHLLEQAILIYVSSQQFQNHQRDTLLKQYSQYRKRGNYMIAKEKRVPTPGIYQNHALSYPAAITGILQAVGEKWSVEEVAAFIGLGFIINVHKNEICPSGPTALAAWSQVHAMTELLGWKFKYYVEEGSFPNTPESEEKLGKEDEDRALHLFEMVKKAIDSYQRPVVIWGIPVPEYGIVNGYQDEFYLVSTFRSLISQEETPISYRKIEAPGCIEAFILEKKTTAPNNQTYKRTLEFGIQMAKGLGVSLPGYISGPESYNVLNEHLINTPEETFNKFGFAYMIDCYLGGRNSVYHYLQKIAQFMLEHKVSKQLIITAETYREMVKKYKGIQKYFPMFGDQDISIQSREVCSKLLREIQELEKSAIKQLEECLNLWI